MFAARLSTGATLIVKSCGTHIRDGASSNQIDSLTYFLQILNLKGHQNCFNGSNGAAILLNLRQDYSALWHCGNHNLTAESPQISTSWPQTPAEEIGKLCQTQEVLIQILKAFCDGCLCSLISQGTIPDAAGNPFTNSAIAGYERQGTATLSTGEQDFVPRVLSAQWRTQSVNYLGSTCKRRCQSSHHTADSWSREESAAAALWE